MRFSVFARLLAGVILAAGGCRAPQLARDQDHIRTAVLDLHTAQIMDNLVRLRKGLPVVHLDYTNMTGTITQNATGMVGGKQTGLANQIVNAPAAALAVARTVTDEVTGSGSAGQMNQLTITAQPVTNAPEVYNAYITFLKCEDHLRESPEPPPCGAALAVRCYHEGDCDGCCDHGWFHKRPCRKTYYWVPVEYRDAFRRLSVFTVAVRGQPVVVSPNFDVTVLGLMGRPEPVPGTKDTYQLRLKIDPAVPNDKGHLVATVKGRLFDEKGLLKIIPNPDVILAQPIDPVTAERKTDVILLSVNTTTLGVSVDELVKDLAGKKVGVRLENFAPTGSPTDRVLNDIRNQVELLRLSQQMPRP